LLCFFDVLIENEISPVLIGKQLEIEDLNNRKVLNNY